MAVFMHACVSVGVVLVNNIINIANTRYTIGKKLLINIFKTNLLNLYTSLKKFKI